MSFVLSKHITEIAKKEKLAEEQAVYIDYIQELVNNLRRQKHEFNGHIGTVYGTLLYGKGDKIESAKAYIEKLNYDSLEEVEIQDIGDSALTGLLFTKLAIAGQKQIPINTNIKGDITNTTLSFPEISVIINNLLTNAMEFSETLPIENRNIELSIQDINGVVVIEVSNKNNNSPIPNDILTKIFDSGFTTKDNYYKDRGFGLHNVKDIVSKHRDNISVQSNNEYTTFTVELRKVKQLAS